MAKRALIDGRLIPSCGEDVRGLDRGRDMDAKADDRDIVPRAQRFRLADRQWRYDSASSGTPSAVPRGKRTAIGPSYAIAVATMWRSSFSSFGAITTMFGMARR